MARVDRWKEPEFISLPFTTIGSTFTEDDTTFSDHIRDIQDRFYSSNAVEKVEWKTNYSLLRGTKELIYDVQDNKPIFHVIAYSFNVRRGELQVSHLLEQIVEGDSIDEISDDVRQTLAMAHIYEVPVYPNTDELVKELAEYYKDMMVEGFSLPDGQGGRGKYRLTKSPGSKIDAIDFFDELSLAEPRYVAELSIIRDSVKKELNKLSEVKKLLGSLEIAISELEKLLNKEGRNESELQSCLTEYPVLLGLEYRKVIPKYKLGAEYEMDYALQRSSGLVDLMEIEASNLPIFNQKGDPSHYLIHAEQQVLDWLAWIERNNPYAREGLPGIMKPVGFVVIGRSTILDSPRRNRLKQRNALFRGDLQILTYDDVLEKAQTMYRVITGIDV
jgi:Domain of unknown function (DUF4263)